MFKFPTILVAATLMGLTANASAQEFKSGAITVQQPWARSTPKGATIGGGYVVISNSGEQPDKLTGGSADFANSVQVHQMSMANGVMKMRQLTEGLAVPANGKVALTPGTYHLMFVGLKRPLVKGETVKVTLSFEHAGEIPVEFKVGGIADVGPGGPAKSHGAGGMDMPGMKM